MSSPQTVYWPGASGYASVYAPLVASAMSNPAPFFLDYPGLGNAPREPGIDSLDKLYGFAIAQLPARCDLVALSMGCSLALRAALELPERIRRMVIIAASGGIDVRGLGGSDWRSDWSARRPEAPRWFVDDCTDLSDRLRELDVPTLLIFGDADPIAPVAVGRYLHERLQRSTLEVIAGATHDLIDERAPQISNLIAHHLE